MFFCLSIEIHISNEFCNSNANFTLCGYSFPLLISPFRRLICSFIFFCLAGECIEFCEFRFGLAANIRIQGQMTSAKHFLRLPLLLFCCCSHIVVAWGIKA